MVNYRDEIDVLSCQKLNALETEPRFTSVETELANSSSSDLFAGNVKGQSIHRYDNKNKGELTALKEVLKEVLIGNC